LDTNCASPIEHVANALLSINKVSLTLAFERSGMDATRFAEDVLVPVLDQIGDRWQRGELSLSQVYMSGRMCEKLLDDISAVRPENMKDHGIAVAVLEDFHLLGKRIVCSVLHAAGFLFKDYGPLSLEDLVEKVRADNIRILLVSTLMLSSALRVKLLKERLDALGLEVKLIVGGAPFRFDPNLWREVNADATSVSASGIAAILNTLIAEVTHDNV
jgi:methanogenic corrinoid protein MtbC1